MDLQQFKTQIFEGINDQPISATAEAASNGSDTIAKINGLIDAIEINRGKLAETWAIGTSFYLDLDLGDDANDGLSLSSPKLTVSAIINLITSKKIDDINLLVSGTIRETLDFSQAWSDKKGFWYDGNPKISISTNNSYSIEHDGEIFKSNPLIPFYITFFDCALKATDKPLLIFNQSGIFKFNNCNFYVVGSTEDSIIWIENSNTVIFYANYAGVVETSGNYCWGGIIANNKSKVLIDGLNFDGFDYGFMAYEFSKIINAWRSNNFINSETAAIEDYSSFKTSYPDAYLDTIYLDDLSEFNLIKTERFVLNSATDTVIKLLTNLSLTRAKIHKLLVNDLPTGTTIEILRNSTTATGIIADESNLSVVASFPLPILYLKDELSLQITGTINDNTVIEINLVEF